MQRATEMLRDGTVSITNISEDLGYSSPAGFTRAFRKATGFGPREFRVKEKLSAADPEGAPPERTGEL
jgi:AraC-like DNA-binding protein